MKFPKIAVFVAAALAVGACSQNVGRNGAITNVTPAVFGHASPNLPAGWKQLSSVSGERGIAFGCLPDECRNPGLIGYMALRTVAEIEPADSKVPVSAEVLNKVHEEIARASGGVIGNVATRKLSRSGNEVEQTMTITKEKTAYAIIRISRLPNEVRTVFASGMTREQSRRNMRIALGGINP